MKKYSFLQRMMGLFLCVALLASYAPLVAQAATPLAQSTVTATVTDPGTAADYEHMMGTDADGNRYAGQVWADKSVYKNGDTVVLNSKGNAGSSFTVSLEEDEAFQIVFSVLGSSMTTTETVSSIGPMDVVFIIDNSDSMSDNNRMRNTIQAANSLLEELLKNNDVRLGITAYAQSAATVLPFGTYTDGVQLQVNNYSSGGVITAYDSDGSVINRNYKSNGYEMNTNIQAGFELAMEMLAGATNTAGRKPIVILLTDGAANTASDTLFVSGRNGTIRQIYYSNNIDPMIALSTLLSNAYNKAVVEEHYGESPMVYGIGVDLQSNDGSNAIIDPAKNFNSNNNNSNIRSAYSTYINTWLTGGDINITSGTGSGWGSSNYTFRFGHDYPSGSGITDRKVANNINYVDSYYAVASAGLQGVFEQIYEQMTSAVFNPITSSTTAVGGTGAEDTPLIYVDFIGEHMEVKEIEAITLFGSSYSVVKNANGTYTVAEATGINPTTNERWNTAEDIRISVIPQADGTQKLEIQIDQEILPIILEKTEAETVNEQTTATITEFKQEPLRVFYTVGVDSDVLLPNGEIDVSQLQGYQHINNADGTVSFYSNRFGVENAANPGQPVMKGDSHVGFRPSAQNRYYYHQKNQGIFTSITDKNGKPVTINSKNEYGIVWSEEDYNLHWMTYDEYLTMQPGMTVYTYVTYYHPTPDTNDAPNAAEEITYLVYTDWLYLKESVAFYDDNTKTYLNDGKVIPEAQVQATIAAYLQANPDASLYAVLGVGSRRTSRLHNMMHDKVSNNTGTAVESYTPEYLENKAAHNNNDVVVWLGNNGKLTVKVDTGIALTKAVTEPIGSANDVYTLTVTVPAGVVADPVVMNTNGDVVPSTYSGNVLSVNVKAGQTVYVTGIPAGTQCDIGEVIAGDYYIASKTDTVTIPQLSDVFNGAAQFVSATVTNAPNKYGNLHITKRITSDHAIPASVLETPFNITVNVGTALAGESYFVKISGDEQTHKVTVDATGNLYFQIKARQTIDILSLPYGTAVTVTEANPGNHFAVSYETRNHSGENADTDNVVVIPANGGATALVTNHYTPEPVSVDLDIAGTKNFTAQGSHSGGSFTFKVQKWNATAWEDISGKTAQTTYAADEDGSKQFTISDVLAGVTYTEVGSYAYQVVEVKGDVENITYDRTLYTFTVTVTDNGGQLVAAVTDLNNTPITDGSYEVTFNNTHHTAPVSIDLQKIVKNPSGADAISAAGFEFTVLRTDDQWNAYPGATAQSVFTDAAGEARFTEIFTSAGVYYYVIEEVNQAKPGWVYSGAEYHVTVTVVIDNGDPTATITIEKHSSQNAEETATVNASDATSGKITFVNTYAPTDASANLDGVVSKELTGKVLQAGQFTFYVYEDGDRTAAELTGTNGFNGNVSRVDFDDVLTFDTVGVYRYDIVEAIPTGAVLDEASGKYVLNGMYYDPTIFDLEVEVSNNAATGALVATYYFDDAVEDAVTFQNEYRTTPTEYTFSGVKVLHGRATRTAEFSFELYQGTELVQKVYNKADGSFVFDTIVYDQVGEYTYTIKEVAGDVPGVTYDGVNAPITVTVTVTDTNGVLSASADVENTAIVFENTYTAQPAQITFSGTKILEGGVLQDDAFTFKLYETDLSFDITANTAKLLDTKKNAGGEFAFVRDLDVAGTYYFAVVEDATENTVENVVYDRTQHTFAVQISDLGTGKLSAVITNMTTGETTRPDTLVSADVVFTNATFEEAAKKEVYISGTTTTQIDGQEVKAGDVLTYHITYTNYTGDDVVVDIEDTIPNYTSYVDGSASHGGSYAGRHIAWILNVAKGESVTVSFEVKVEEVEAQATISNLATIRDGVNTYTTNEVTNPVRIPEPEPAPTEPTEPSAVPTEPSTEPTEPPTAPPTEQPTVPPTEPPVPPTESTAPPTEPSVPPAEPTVPPTEPPVPPTEPTEPPTEPTEPPTVPPVVPPKDPEVPKTGDYMHLHMWFAVLFVSSGGMIITFVLGKKKKAELH